jgi:hypothetical protein
MRTLIFALAVVIPVSCLIDQASAADRPPTFNIDKNCTAEVAGGANTAEACKHDEIAARDEAVKRWSQFSPANKKSCVGESSIGGEQSYVELLSCLEMSSGGNFSGGQK